MTSTTTISDARPVGPDGNSTLASASDNLKWPLRLWGTLIALCIVLFLDGLDVSMVGVALPSIGTELNLTTSTLQWLISGYVLGYGGLLLLGGRTADLLGRRRVFLIALAVFAVASLLGGVVDDGPLLIATRFIKGLSAAFTAPTGLSIITTTFAQGKARNKALSIYTVFGASGFSFGLVFGGLMTGIGWRWTFLLPVPIAIIALVMGYFLIPKDTTKAEGGHDIVGAILSTAGMLLLVYTVVSAPQAGWASARTLGSFVLVVVLFASFIAVEKRVAHPLVRLGILRNGTLVRANLAIVGLFGSFASFQFIVTLYFQDTLGWSPLHMALALLPTGLLVAFSAPFAGSVIDRVGTPRLIIAGLAAMTLGYVLFLRVDTHPIYALAIMPTALLLGVGFALAFPAINVQATNGIEDEEQGLAAGLVQSSAQVGAALVLAVTTAIISAHGTGTGSAADMLASYKPGLIFVTCVALAGLLVTLVRKRA
ncbi:MFS transporter [Antrihabitans cavernicola]|nr:MFS transporter [Spelaeibacter cavernicola]